jgi:hypothetical protein
MKYYNPEPNKVSRSDISSVFRAVAVTDWATGFRFPATAKLIAHLHVLPKLGMRGALSPLPIYA